MMTTEYPEFLFHVKRTITDYREDTSGGTQIIDIIGTFTDLTAAKKAAYEALATEGYIKDDFERYEVNDKLDAERWPHGDGVFVFAKAPAGQEFEVSLDTKSNVLKFKGNDASKVEGYLHYVLQTTINYNTDRNGGFRITEVEGTYPSRKAAFEAAKTILLDDQITKNSFAEYDEKGDFIGEWPFGDECQVHAVGQGGENFMIIVKAQLHNHRHHERKHYRVRTHTGWPQARATQA